MKTITFSDLENVLRVAIKLCDEPLNKIAVENGFTASGLSSFTTKKCHISAEKGDRLIEYFQLNYPEVWDLAYCKVLSVNGRE